MGFAAAQKTCIFEGKSKAESFALAQVVAP